MLTPYSIGYEASRQDVLTQIDGIDHANGDNGEGTRDGPGFCDRSEADNVYY